MHRLCKNRRQATIFGVCAGISQHLGWDTTGCRLALILIAMMIPVTAIGAYLVAALVLPEG